MNDPWSTAVGRQADTRRVFTAEDLTDYATASGDTVGATVPEPLLAGMISGLLGHDLPGPGSIYLQQTFRFARSARPGEELTARVTVTATRPDRAVVVLTTTVSAGDELVAEGSAVVLARGWSSEP